MDILVLIDKLDDMIHNARPVPLTDQVRIDKKPVYDVIDEIRAALPRSITQARAADAAQAPPVRVEPEALNAAVSAAIRQNIPEIARAVAAAIGSGPSNRPTPGAPF